MLSSLAVRNFIIYRYILRNIHQKAMSNIHTQMSSNQSEERTIVFTHEKNDTSNQNSQRCVSFTQKFPPQVLVVCSALTLWVLCRHAAKKFSSKSFLCKKERNIAEIGVEWFHVFSVRVLSRIYPLWEKSRVAERHKLHRGVHSHAPLGSIFKWICAEMQSAAFWDTILRNFTVVFYSIF